MSTQTRPPIVVGLSASAASAAALRWAAAEASREHRSVRAVHVFDVAERTDAQLERPGSGPDPELSVRYAGRVGAVLDGTDASVSLSILAGAVVDALAEASTGASVLVVGQAGDCRHRGLVDELRLRVACPVVVVPAA